MLDSSKYGARVFYNERRSHSWYFFFHSSINLLFLELRCIHNLPYVPKSGWKHADLTLAAYAPVSETSRSELSPETRDIIAFDGICFYFD
jgi:hypothetical protein